MSKIFYIMGKSASGKDSLYARLLSDSGLNLKRLVLYTTRPIRQGEADGREYHFTDEAGMDKFRRDGRVIEERTYQTVAGPWTYATVDDGRSWAETGPYLAIGTLESYVKMRAYFSGSEADGRPRVEIVPLYIEVSDPVRLKRAIDRETAQSEPNYQEVCRRFLADSEDFAEEKIAEAGIKRRFLNEGDLDACLSELEEFIQDVI